MKKSLNENTICVQGGYSPKNGEPRILPIFQSTTYKYDNADEVGKLFDLEAEGHMYSRISNPTVEALEKKLAAMEDGVGAVCTSSGQSATFLSILTICRSGQHVLAMSNLYGGTYTLFVSTFAKLGIEVSFVDVFATAEEIEQKIQPNTRLIFGETVGNPGVDVMDIELVAGVAHKHKIPFIVDNTFATPYLCNPIHFGADIVVHSTTKYLDGHATSVGGCVIDSGKFNWENGNFPELTEPDPSYHGISYTTKFGEKAYITKLRAAFLRDIGNTMSPFNAFLTNLGTETLALRMQRHSENALEIAHFLEKHPKVAWIHYPLLEESKSFERASRYLEHGGSGIISFGVTGGCEAGKQFMNQLKLASLVVHVGDVRTHVLHPASMTHRQLSEQQQREAGILPEMIRLSVGIEDVEDIRQDLGQSLDQLEWKCCNCH